MVPAVVTLADLMAGIERLPIARIGEDAGLTMIDLLNSPGEEPDASLSVPLQALWWLKQGSFKMGPEWEKAHNLCQQDEGNPAHDLVHALAHWIEGDSANAAYWYARVGEAPRRQHRRRVAADCRKARQLRRFARPLEKPAAKPT